MPSEMPPGLRTRRKAPAPSSVGLVGLGRLILNQEVTGSNPVRSTLRALGMAWPPSGHRARGEIAPIRHLLDPAAMVVGDCEGWDSGPNQVEPSLAFPSAFILTWVWAVGKKVCVGVNPELAPTQTIMGARRSGRDAADCKSVPSGEWVRIPPLPPGDDPSCRPRGAVEETVDSQRIPFIGG